MAPVCRLACGGMAITDLAPAERIELSRGDVVVCVPLYSAHDHFVRCLRALLEHTPTSVPILIADDATPEPASRAFVDELQASGAIEHELVWLRRTANGGFVENVNDAFRASAPADIVLVNSDVVVAAGWLEGLRDAAHADSTIATATALTNHGTIVSVPHRNRPQGALPQDITLADAAARVRHGAPRLRPRIPVAIGHCLYIRRTALDLVGEFDTTFSPGYGEEVDFSQRCLAMGLQHVVADDVFVAHHGGGSFDELGQRSETQVAHERIIDTRYPYYAPIIEHVAADSSSPLAHAVAGASRALRGLRVTIDGRALGPALTGTQVHTLELVAALTRTGAARVRVLLPEQVGDYVSPALASLPDVEKLSVRDAEDAEPDDIVHRPWQVNSVEDLVLLHNLGARVVLTQQDLIAYRNPSYFPDADAWLEYRRLAAQVMGVAAMTLFFSRHAHDDALAEELVPPGRARVVLIGTDHRVAVQRPQPTAPAGHDLGDRPFLLCLGTDFRHKNRLFALRVLEALAERHGWPGRLVLAGPHVQFGSSSADEAAFLAARPQLRESVVELPAVTEPEKAWLMSHCVAVMYPTTYEGFGLVPFEAADAGRPCVFAHQASLGELVEEEAALIVPWDAAATADRMIGVLTDAEQAERQLQRVRDSGSVLTWDRTGRELVAAYEEALTLPSRTALRAGGPVDARYWTLRNQIGPTGLSLVGPDRVEGPLLPVGAQRGLAALARRPITRQIVVGALRFFGGLGGGGSRNGGAPALPPGGEG